MPRTTLRGVGWPCQITCGPALGGKCTMGSGHPRGSAEFLLLLQGGLFYPNHEETEVCMVEALYETTRGIKLFGHVSTFRTNNPSSPVNRELADKMSNWG